MKWIVGYVVGAALLLTPVVLRVALRSEPAPKPLDQAAVAQGKTLFEHEWQVNDPLCNGGDGLGPVFNGKSCVECHNQGGVGGSGANKHNVTMFFKPAVFRDDKPVQGVIHTFAIDPKYQENLSHADSRLNPLVRPDLKQIEDLKNQDCGRVFTSGGEVTQRNTPALFGAKLIDELPERVLLAQERTQKLRWHSTGGETVPVGRALRLPNGKLGKFGWKGQSASLIDFVQAACANELGLGNPGQAQPTPLALTSYKAKGLDLTTEQCEQMAAFIAALPRPVEKDQADPRVRAGRQHFHNVGCAECHVPVGSPGTELEFAL